VSQAREHEQERTRIVRELQRITGRLIDPSEKDVRITSVVLSLLSEAEPLSKAELLWRYEDCSSLVQLGRLVLSAVKKTVTEMQALSELPDKPAYEPLWRELLNRLRLAQQGLTLFTADAKEFEDRNASERKDLRRQMERLGAELHIGWITQEEFDKRAIELSSREQALKATFEEINRLRSEMNRYLPLIERAGETDVAALKAAVMAFKGNGGVAS
jgi:ABC-type phosphate transport system auxiliary subunit